MLDDKVDDKYYLSGYELSKIIYKDDVKRGGYKVREATKKGYTEAFLGDSINLEQPKSKTRRGRVGHQISQTLMTSCNQVVIVNE